MEDRTAPIDKERAACLVEESVEEKIACQVEESAMQTCTKVLNIIQYYISPKVMLYFPQSCYISPNYVTNTQSVMQSTLARIDDGRPMIFELNLCVRLVVKC